MTARRRKRWRSTHARVAIASFALGAVGPLGAGPALIGRPSVARADDAQPWSAGVTAAAKAAAQKLLEAGNAKFLEHDYAAALDRYKQAVASWDHPAIRFNIVRCLIQLDRGVEAFDNLQLALKYGAAPLEDAVYNEALAYQKLLANQIGEVEVACTQPGVKIAFDGQPLPPCPAAETKRIGVGAHQLIATGDGMVPRTIELAVAGGKHQRVAIELVPFAKAGKVTHRWATWVPWVVVAGGAVVAGIGGLIEYQAAHDYSTYDQGIAQACANVGCGPGHPVPRALADLEHRASAERAVSIGVITTGIAALIAGGAMVYLNRDRMVFPSSTEHLTPVVTPTAGGAALSFVGQF